ncbi:sensor domain-containing diguanylate cyclase [Leptospira sp. GIMC2001]|uniref:sensor domain-containing diguanylate cyclase n=1 Tax=Leptospira sp. GIMC2001 TaxID=1513297 RepID=UPI00234BDF7D|nr:sensor domain-containing diguanylate cyclase [Leptospira sp. GIMC2001]WCL49365.1 sensor domain-containing diguanylate cyclase [Leptospira sp. GIMC2001]
MGESVTVIPSSLFEEIIAKALDAVWVINEDNEVEFMNPAAEILSGYTKLELVGQSFSTIIPPNYAGDHLEYIRNYLDRNTDDNSTVLGKVREFYIYSKDKVAIPIELKAFEIGTNVGEKRKFAGIMRDIRARKQLEENQKMTMVTLKKLAFIDELTMIPNRRSFYETFRKLLAGIQRKHRFAVIGLVDIDNFKEINDKYGHDIGDMVLIHVSKVFIENLREEDTVGRIGGEEFGLLLPETDLEGAYIVLERLRIAVKQYKFFVFENFYLNVTISTGFVNIGSEQTVEEIIKCADIALYKAKSAGKDIVSSY